MDDVSSSAKIATKQTAGVLGDDLAVNAAKASTFPPSRELPVIWAITKGSLINKIIIVPLMLILSYYYKEAITPILLLGASYLSYEGAHGIWGWLFPHSHNSNNSKKLTEKAKIKSAILTDFILSIEIVLIALSTVNDLPIIQKSAVVFLVAFIATIGVYGFVALLVRLDDIGYAIAKDKPQGSFKQKFGLKLASLLPIIIKILSIVGVFAMLLVAGGILMHKISILEEILHPIPTLLAELLSAIFLGAILMLIIDGTKSLLVYLKK
jgi:predicted DNA repair protein MutK